MKLWIILLIFPVWSEAKTLHVGKSGGFKSIKSAIHAAGIHDTILIDYGIYQEGNIFIENPLHLIGMNFPVIDGQEKYEILTIKSSNVSVSGIKFIGSGKGSLEDRAAIRMQNVSNVSIINNSLQNNYFGIYLANANNCIVEKNAIVGWGTNQQSSGNGIHLWKCGNIKIQNNTIKGHRDGIYFEFVTGSSIRKNVSEDNLRYGLHFMFSDNDVYEENTFRNNGAGVAVMYTRNVKMLSNHFELNWGSGAYAILLKEITDSEIKGNFFSGNTTGIFAEGVSRTVVSSNTFTQNGWALRITSNCDQLTVVRNNFTGNTFDIATNGNSNVTVNTFDGNYWDKYKGYDLNRDGLGDVPYYAVTLSALLMEKIPPSVYFLHSFMLNLIDRTEEMMPHLIPEDIRDNTPAMKMLNL